jgi:hypothetical protein
MRGSCRVTCRRCCLPPRLRWPSWRCAWRSSSDERKDLAAKVTRFPEVEAQLKQLDRDYEVIKKQHTKLLERRESARLSRT